MEKKYAERYWDDVALEAKDFEKAIRIEKWRKAARNWLPEYADGRANDFVTKVVDQIVKLKSRSKVLDVGCGPGKWTMLLSRKCSSVTAVDISSNMILLAKENARKGKVKNAVFEVMPVSRLQMNDETFDLVNCVTVLQHVADDSDWGSAIGEMTRVTRRGGYILLFEAAPTFVVKKRTPRLALRTMQQYVNEFRKAGAPLVYWQAADLSLPVTIFGLKSYAASFNEKVYYFIPRSRFVPPRLLSFLSWIAVLLAKQIDYRLAETPLNVLSIERLLLFKKIS